MLPFSWIIFTLLILTLLFLDLAVLNRKEEGKISIKKGLLLSGFWIFLSLLFCLWIYWSRGREDALNFLTGYLIEKALSIDNLFVFLLIFSSFQIPDKWRHKVLFWGIIGALISRGLFILGGVALVSRFDWLLYLFGIFLMLSAIKLVKDKEEKVDLEKNIFIRWLKRTLPIIETNPKGEFLRKIGGKVYATPLFLALISIESADLIFALDSIPAIFGITQDPYIIYTSNIFAILGLRSLYFALEGLINLFRFLHYGLAAILFLIGAKMLFKDFIHLPPVWSLAVIVLILALSILLSLSSRKEKI